MKKIFYTLIILLSFISIKAQHIAGVVTSNNTKQVNEPVTGATVFWMGTSIVAITDENGKFSIDNPENLPAKLLVSFIGFSTDTITVTDNNQPDLKIILKTNTILKEVTITEKQASSVYSIYNPINTQIITDKELQKAACCNLSESFTTNASVDIAFTDAVSGAKKIQMLGLDGVYTQILSENMPLLRGLSAAYGLSYIPGTWIDKIMVTKGTGSVVNGYESISGQINLEFIKPENTKYKFFTNIYTNEKGRAEVNTHVVKKLNEKWSTILFTHVSDMSHKQDKNNDSFLDMPLTRQYSVFNKWNYHSGKKWEGQLGLKALMENRKGGQTNFNYTTDYQTNRSYGIGINTTQAEYFTKTGYIFNKPGRSFGLQTSGKWQLQDMYFGIRKYNGQQKNFYANFIFADLLTTSNHKYKVGASYMYDEYNEKYNDSTFGRVEHVPGAFAEYSFTHPDNFSLVVGLRADYHNSYGIEYTPRIHMRYNVTKSTTVRLSGGKGFRTPNIFIENQSVFASSRKVEIQELFKPEIAWNYGVSINQKFTLFENEAFINVDFFRTDFENQVIMDLDQSVNKVVFYNLKGKSYSHSLQVDAGFEPIEAFAIKVAYKWYDVKTTYNYELMDKPFIPKHRVMVNLAYATYMDVWKFDLTGNWFGQSRIPSTVQSPPEYRLPIHSNDYYLLQCQITRRFKAVEIYLGCENILDYRQQNPIIAPHDPFGNNFDASMIYAPIDGRTIYLGLRLTIK